MSTSYPDVVLLSFGIYNPPIPKHFRIYEVARDHFEQINKSRVILGIVVIVSQESDEKSEIASLEHRRSMIRLALRSSEWIKLSDKNYNCGEPNAVENLLKYHQNVIDNFVSGSTSNQNRELPNWLPSLLKLKDRVQVKLLGGSELFEIRSGLSGECSEGELEMILQNHGLIIVSKGATCYERILFESDLLTKYKSNITIIMNWASSEVTSSLVRRLINRKQSIKYLLDDSVIEYIRANNLYAYFYDRPSKLPGSMPVLQDVHASTSGEDITQKTVREHSVECSGNLSEFLKFAIETKRIKAVQNQHPKDLGREVMLQLSLYTTNGTLRGKESGYTLVRDYYPDLTEGTGSLTPRLFPEATCL